MSSFFAGPSRMKPWIEESTFRALVNGPEPHPGPKLAQVLARRLASNADGRCGHCPSFLVVHDGKTSAIAFLSDDSSIRATASDTTKGCIVRVSNWNVSLVDHCAGSHVAHLRSKRDEACSYLDMQPRLCLRVNKVETIGAHDIGIVGDPVHVHQSLQVRRALLSLETKHKTLAQQLKLVAPLGSVQELFRQGNTNAVNALLGLDNQNANNENPNGTTAVSTNGAITSRPATSTPPANSGRGVVLGNVQALFESSRHQPPASSEDNAVSQIIAMANSTSSSSRSTQQSNATAAPNEHTNANAKAKGSLDNAQQHQQHQQPANHPNGVVLGDAKALLQGKSDVAVSNTLTAIFAATQAMDAPTAAAAAIATTTNSTTSSSCNGKSTSDDNVTNAQGRSTATAKVNKSKETYSETSANTREDEASPQTDASKSAPVTSSGSRTVVNLGNAKALFNGAPDSGEPNPVEAIFEAAKAMDATPISIVPNTAASRCKQTHEGNDNSTYVSQTSPSTKHHTDSTMDDSTGTDVQRAIAVEPYGVRERIDSRASVVSLSGFSSVLKSVFRRKPSFTENASIFGCDEADTSRSDANKAATLDESPLQGDDDDSESEVAGISEMLISQTQKEGDGKETFAEEGVLEETTTVLSKKRSVEQALVDASNSEASANNTTPKTQTRDDFDSMDIDGNGFAQEKGAEESNAEKPRDCKRAKTSQGRKKKKNGVGTLKLWKELRARRKERLGNESG